MYHTSNKTVLNAGNSILVAKRPSKPLGEAEGTRLDHQIALATVQLRLASAPTLGTSDITHQQALASDHLPHTSATHDTTHIGIIYLTSNTWPNLRDERGGISLRGGPRQRGDRCLRRHDGVRENLEALEFPRHEQAAAAQQTNKRKASGEETAFEREQQSRSCFTSVRATP